MAKLTIELSEDVFRQLLAGRSQSETDALIESLLRPQVMHPDLDQGYADMARFEAETPDSDEWSDDHLKDLLDASR